MRVVIADAGANCAIVDIEMPPTQSDDLKQISLKLDIGHAPTANRRVPAVLAFL